MAAFSAADVKTLRDRLGAGMLDSKNALVEADGDIEKAIEILRVKGLKGVEKRSGRATTAGLVTAKAERRRRDPHRARERDRLRREERPLHRRSPTSVLDAVAAAGADRRRVRQRRAASTARPSQAYIDDEAALLGEKVELRQVTQVKGEEFAIYLHKTSKDLPPAGRRRARLRRRTTPRRPAPSRSTSRSTTRSTRPARRCRPRRRRARARDRRPRPRRNEGKPEAPLAEDRRGPPDRLLQGGRRSPTSPTPATARSRPARC